MATPEGLEAQAESASGDSGEEAGARREDDEKELPQVFFFPSGEVTPVTVSVLSNDDLDHFRRWQIGALGQVTDPDAVIEDDQDDDDLFEEDR